MDMCFRLLDQLQKRQISQGLDQDDSIPKTSYQILLELAGTVEGQKHRIALETWKRKSAFPLTYHCIGVITQAAAPRV